ncbi:hypothetical protein ACWPKO_16795 [Coraliomargarita sp. W4R53]
MVKDDFQSVDKMENYKMKKIRNIGFALCVTASVLSAQASTELQPLGTMDGFYRNTAVLDRTLDNSGLMWNIPDWMTETDFPYPKKPFEKELPFADAATMVRLLGGWMDHKQAADRVNDVNDLAGRDADGDIFYRWDLLKARLDPYVAQGYELTLVLDNVPHCFPDLADSGKHFGQVGPPADMLEWYGFIYAMCDEIKRLYGVEIQERIRFRMGTEMQDDRRFAGTFEQYCQMYDFAAKAVKEVFPHSKFGPFNRSMPQGSFENFGGLVSGNVGLLKLADHCANGVNTATGEIGSPFDFAPRSFYYFSSMRGNGKLTNIQPDERLPEFKAMWDAIEAVSPQYQGISKEVQEFGAHLNTEGGIYGLDTGARGAAQNFDTIVGMKAIGVDRIWHWEVFEKMPQRNTLLMSQGWLYSVFERMIGGELYRVPVQVKDDSGNRLNALLSVKESEAVLVVSDWNPDRLQQQSDLVSLVIPSSVMPLGMQAIGMLSFTEENSVYDVIRRDLKAAGLLAKKHLDHRGTPATTVAAGGYTFMAVDRQVGRNFVMDHWSKYMDLMQNSLMLKPFEGSIKYGEGSSTRKHFSSSLDHAGSMTVAFEAANPSVTVLVFKLAE